jgi:hypothetical protein
VELDVGQWNVEWVEDASRGGLCRFNIGCAVLCRVVSWCAVTQSGLDSHLESGTGRAGQSNV